MVQIERTQFNIQSTPRLDGKAGQGKTQEQLQLESEQSKELQAKQEAALYNQLGSQNALPGEQKVIEPNIQYKQGKTAVGAARQKQAESKTLVGEIKTKNTVVGEIKTKNTVVGEIKEKSTVAVQNQPTTGRSVNAQNLVAPQAQAQTNVGQQAVAPNPNANANLNTNIQPPQAGGAQQNPAGRNTQAVPEVRPGTIPGVGQVNNAAEQQNVHPVQAGGRQQAQPAKEPAVATENQEVQTKSQAKTRETQKVLTKQQVKAQQDQKQSTKVTEQQNIPVSVQTQKGLNVNNLI